MKNLLIIAAIILGTLTNATSQVSFNLKLGISPASSPLNAGIIVNRENPIEEFEFNMVHTNPQYFAGAGIHLSLSTPFFLEAGLTYTQKKSFYQVDYSLKSEFNPGDALLSETEKIILLPVNLGVSIGVVSVTSGLTAMKTVAGSNELTGLKGFHSEQSNVRLGWQMGARYELQRIAAGVEYQSCMNRVCEGMYVDRQSLEVMNVPGNWVFSLQFKF
jgi:hypothetical protein